MQIAFIAWSNNLPVSKAVLSRMCIHISYDPIHSGIIETPMYPSATPCYASQRL